MIIWREPNHLARTKLSFGTNQIIWPTIGQSLSHDPLYILMYPKFLNAFFHLKGPIPDEN